MFTFGDGAECIAPPMIKAERLGFFDELEEDCWGLFVKYCDCLGIELENRDEIDWYTAKGIQDKIIDVFIEAGINIKTHSDLMKEIAVFQSQIDDKANQLRQGGNILSYTSIRERLIKIGELLMVQSKLAGKQFDMTGIILDDNEAFTQFNGFVGDAVLLDDVEGHPLHIGDTIALDTRDGGKYNRMVLKGFFKANDIKESNAILVKPYTEFDIEDANNAAFTLYAYSCQELARESISQIQELLDDNGMEMS